MKTELNSIDNFSQKHQLEAVLYFLPLQPVAVDLDGGWVVTGHF